MGTLQGEYGFLGDKASEDPACVWERFEMEHLAKQREGLESSMCVETLRDGSYRELST